MNKRMLTSVLLAALFMVMALPFQSQAQWGIGASYEIREEVPENGFGVRLERSILGKLPLVNLRLRAHFSYFSEENNVSQGGATVSGDFTNYDYGVAGIGGISLGLLTPYVGLGIGSTTFDAKFENAPNPGSDTNFFWNALIGAEVSPIPAISPFVEYRFQQADDPEDIQIDDSNGRLVFGVTLNF